MQFKPALVWNSKCVPSAVDSFSPSWRKPREFVNCVSDLILSSPVRVIESGSAKHMLSEVHHPDYVKSVFSGRAENGFYNRDPLVAEACGYTCGAFVEGVLQVLDGYSSCAPVSGFHHAGYMFSGGFCTFNGFALGAVVALGVDLRPGLIDCDQHYGDGTADILSELGLHNDIPHFTYGQGYSGYRNAERFLEDLPTILEKKFSKCGVLLYQAGADPHVDDPLGGSLTSNQLAFRDITVFKFARDHGIPVVWDLAGGYQRNFKDVLAIHRTTFKIWLESLR